MVRGVILGCLLVLDTLAPSCVASAHKMIRGHGTNSADETQVTTTDWVSAARSTFRAGTANDEHGVAEQVRPGLKRPHEAATAMQAASAPPSALEHFDQNLKTAASTKKKRFTARLQQGSEHPQRLKHVAGGIAGDVDSEGVMGLGAQRSDVSSKDRSGIAEVARQKSGFVSSAGAEGAAWMAPGSVVGVSGHDVSPKQRKKKRKQDPYSSDAARPSTEIKQQYKEYKRAKNWMRANEPRVSKLDSALLLKFHGLFQQAKFGDVNGKRPGMLDAVGRYKWSAWKKNKGMSEEDAITRFTELLSSTVGDDWRYGI